VWQRTGGIFRRSVFYAFIGLIELCGQLERSGNIAMAAFAIFLRKRIGIEE